MLKQKSYILKQSSSKFLRLIFAAIVIVIVLAQLPKNWQQKAIEPKTTASLNQYQDIRLYERFETVPQVPQGRFSYGGATTFAALSREGFIDKIEKIYPQFELSYAESSQLPPGNDSGIQMLLAGQLSFAHLDRPLKEAEVQIAKKQKLRLEAIPVAIDGISIFVNKESQIKSLTIAQLQAIYRGEIANWQQIGGANLPITPITLNTKVDDTIDLIVKNYLATEKSTIVQNYTSAVALTAATPGAIGYGSSAVVGGQESISPLAIGIDANSLAVPSLLADDSVNTQAFAKSIYPLTRRLYVVIPRNGGQEEKAAVAYVNLLLSASGREFIERSGLVPLY